MSALDDKLAAAKRPSVVHTFTIPESVPGDIRSIGLKELTAQDELTASKRAGRDDMSRAYSLIKQALVEVNGSVVSLTDGSADKTWAEMNPQVRQLVVAAYTEIHTTTEETIDSFLKSATVRAG